MITQVKKEESEMVTPMKNVNLIFDEEEDDDELARIDAELARHSAFRK